MDVQYLLMTASKLNKPAKQEWGEPEYLYLDSLHTVWNYRTSMNHWSGMGYALGFPLRSLHTESLSDNKKGICEGSFYFCY